MRNRDLIAFLKPILNQFSAHDSVEFIDVTGQVTDIQADPHRLTIRLNLSAGCTAAVSRPRPTPLTCPPR